MKKATAVLSVLILLAILCDTASARRRMYAQNSSNQTYAPPQEGTAPQTDQERCQAEANHMAANYIYGHCWGLIGRFEGVGWGRSSSPSTCTPSGNMTLTGDATAQASNGVTFRVRSWR